MFFLEIKTKLNLNKKGFTLFETLIAVAMVALIIATVIGIFLSTAGGERRVTQLKTVEDNARYSMETMSREIRMGLALYSDEAGECDDELDFVNANGESERYGLSNGQLIKTVTGVSEAITSQKVKVSELDFCVNNFVGEDVQPRVTILITIESAKDPLAKISLQTTVSLRAY